ncbi:MAG: DNA internalization-related competence protein ComEC/Rec2 [Stenotrophobium sp.]
MNLWQILAFTVGILAVCAMPALPTLPVLTMLAVPALLSWRGRALYAMALLGVLVTVLRGQGLLDQQWPAARYGETQWVQGHVASLPQQSRMSARGEPDGDAAANWQFLFEPGGPGASDFPKRIRASWYRTDQVPKGGDCWRLQLRLRTPHGSLNPGAFDYEGWLLREGIGATATVRDAQACDGNGAQVPRGGKDAELRVAAGQDAQVPRGGKDAGLRAADRQDAQVPRGGKDAGPRVADGGNGYVLLKLRQRLVDRLRAELPDHPAAGLYAALTLGDTSGITTADWDLFRMTGTSHLAAISGLHLGIVAGFAFFLGRWLWALWPRLCLWLPAQKAGTLFSLLVAFIYALLAGLQPPILRALLMLSFAALALWSGRVNRVAPALVLALGLILLLDPLAALRPGLWLSFCAVAAIFYVMMNRLRPPGWLAGLLLVQLMLSLALAPLTLYFFQGMSWISPAVNLLAVPLFSLLMPFLLLGLLLGWLWPWAGVPLTRLCAQVLLLGHDALAWLSTHLPAVWVPACAPVAALLLALFGTALLFVPRGVPLRPLGLLCFLPLLFPPQTGPREGFTLTALDVGQGLSVVVRTAHHTLLYDTGPAFDDGYDSGSSVVAPYLLSQGVSRIDLMMISHADRDHSGGAPAVRRLLAVDDELGALTPHPCHDGQQWEWDGVSFEVLHPDDGEWNTNNGGCVLRVEAGPYAALLPADIQKPAERRLLAEKLTSLQADVLLAPHHGSKTSSTEDFIDAVQPRIVIHSAAWHSQFHHPHPSVVARYAAAGARQYVTGVGGALDLQITERGVSEVSSWRGAHQHFWNPSPELLAQGQYAVMMIVEVPAAGSAVQEQDR